MNEPKSLWAQHIEDACPEGPFPPAESTRHPKWKAVPPGTVIPAGQPYRVEYGDGTAHEWMRGTDCLVDAGCVSHGRTEQWFIDSSWKPPLVLPTEPTWGIAVIDGRGMREVRRWRLTGDGRRFRTVDDGWMLQEFPLADVLLFIPLTDEQVQRIEAAR